MVSASQTATSARMRFSDVSFEAFIWPRPTHGSADWIELATLLSPRGRLAARPARSLPVASDLAAKRLLVLSYAVRIPCRIVTTTQPGRRASVTLDAHFDGEDGQETLRIMSTALQRLSRGTTWLSEFNDPIPAARALWRATLLSNGLIRSHNFSFTVRGPSSERAAALAAAARVLSLSPTQARDNNGVRLSFTPDEADHLLQELLDDGTRQPWERNPSQLIHLHRSTMEARVAPDLVG
ncbi:MAG: hypothetical protein JWN95_1692 [Frankiales bacterium]|nr:hypothetical protein [Frankiales bacterium]